MSNKEEIKKFVKISLDTTTPFILESEHFQISLEFDQDGFRFSIREKVIFEEKQIGSFTLPERRGLSKFNPNDFGDECAHVLKKFDLNNSIKFQNYLIGYYENVLTDVILFFSKIDKIKAFI